MFGRMPWVQYKRVMNTNKHQHPSYEQVTHAWNAQADEHNQWDDLGEDEKIEWAAKYGAEQARVASGCLTADGVAVTPGQQVWVFGTCGLSAAAVDKPVTNYLLFSSPIPVSKSYSSKEAALAAQAKKEGV